MRQWHCSIGGQQYGPVSEDVLRAWIAEGRLHAADHLWSPGRGNWQAAGSVFPELFAPEATGALPPPIHQMVFPGPPGGTGGRTENAQITAQARELLRSRWGLPIGVSLVLALIEGVAGGSGSLVGLVIGGPLTLGGVVFYLTFARRGTCKFEQAFDGFKNFGNALGTYVLIAVFVFLWSLLLIVPGIIASLAYSQAFYLIADDKRLGPMEAIRKSKEMMRRKWKLVCLHLRFLGWGLLCILTLGIGFLWLGPYMAVCLARFYEDLLPPSGTAAAAGAAAGPADPLSR